MGFWLTIGAAVALFFLWRAKRSRSQPTSEFEIRTSITTTVDSRPDKPANPRFATWEEAMNRPVTDDLRFLIQYADADGVVTERIITPKMIRLTAHQPEVRILAYCHLRGEERTFRSERIMGTTNLQTNRPLKDLGQHLRSRY